MHIEKPRKMKHKHHKGGWCIQENRKIKNDKYLNDCNYNQFTFIPVVTTKESVISSTTARLFEKIFKYGKEILNRDNIADKFFDQMVLC